MDISYTAHTRYDDKAGTIVTTLTGDNTGDAISFPTEVGVHVAATVLGEIDKHPQVRPPASDVAAARRDFTASEVKKSEKAECSLDRADKTIDVEAGFLTPKSNGKTMRVHDRRQDGPAIDINLDDGVASLTVFSQIEHAGEQVEVATHFCMDEDLAATVARHLSGPTETDAAEGTPQEDSRHAIPRNHIHIPNLRHNNGTGRNILIDGHPVAVLEGGFEMNGVGDRNDTTTVTLTIMPDKVTVDGDMRDPSA